MLLSTRTQRRIEPADVVFALFLLAYALVSISLIPFDFTDLCYLFSLEQGRWVTQEWVHPIYVPTARLFSGVLGLFGYHEHMLVPLELLNLAAAMAAFTLLYCLARRVPSCSLAAAFTLGVAALSTGFWGAAMRSTPYALAFLSQTLALLLLVSAHPVRARRYALAGGFAGLAMGLHASAMALAVVGVVCALFEPDPARTRRATLSRIGAFGGAMLAVAVVCWMVFLKYNGIGLRYFRNQDFHSTFLGIEQVPGTSIYTSGSVMAQIASFVASLSYQAGILVWLALTFSAVAVVRRRRMPRALSPFEGRLAIATGANFAAIAGFFLINNTHNGFIFASLTLVPVLLAIGIRDSWVGLSALVLLAAPGTYLNVARMLRAGAHGASDPQLTEVRFLEQTLGPRDVLLTPGSPFPEMLYLSHLNIAEVSMGDSTHPGNEVPVLHPGTPLRARIGWWLGHGGRVFYAFGDESTDFTGDVGGAEKEHQIFWRPETAARERAPVLQTLRAALEASGLDVRDGPISPRGERYGEIRLHTADAPLASPPSAAPTLMPDELRTLFINGENADDNPMLSRRAQYLGELAAALPGDPWLACDVMNLICQGEARRDGESVACHPLAGCDETVGPQNWGLATGSGPADHADGGAPGKPLTRQHLTPAMGRVLQDTAGDALQPVLRSGFTVTRLDVHDDAIELAIEDGSKSSYGITLALPDSKRSTPPDGQGRNFLFYLSPPQGRANPEATAALLAAAALFDHAISEAPLEGPRPRGTQRP